MTIMTVKKQIHTIYALITLYIINVNTTYLYSFVINQYESVCNIIAVMLKTVDRIMLKEQAVSQVFFRQSQEFYQWCGFFAGGRFRTASLWLFSGLCRPVLNARISPGLCRLVPNSPYARFVPVLFQQQTTIN